MTSRNTLHTLLIAAALAFGLAGCATTTYVKDPLTTPPAADESPVVASVTANTGQVYGFDELAVRRLPPPQKVAPGEKPVEPMKEFFVLRKVAPGMARDTSLYIGTLPEGEYIVSRLSDFKSRKTLWLARDDGGLLGTFTVKAGHPVDLGRVIITPINQKVLHGRSMLASSNRSLIERFSPEHLRLFSGDVSPGWKPERKPEDRVEEYALGRPVGADCITELPDGRVAMATRLGTVLLRDQRGHWSGLRSGRLESVLCVLPVNLPDADLLAVGEFGLLLRHAPGQTKLVPIDTANLPAGNLLAIAGNANAGWYIALQRADEVSLYHSAQLERGDWNKLRSENVAFSAWNGQSKFWMWNTDGGFAYTVSEGPIHFLDYATGQWTDRATPNERRVIDIRTNPTGVLSMLTSPGGGLGGAFSGVHVSHDQGKTWQNMEVPFTVKLQPVQQASDGTLLMAGGVFGDRELHASSDQGKTWSLLSKVDRSHTITPLKSGGLLGTDHGEFGLSWIEFSKDGGKTWDVEYSNYDRSFDEAGKRK